mmetsp:Transcript_6685/g.19122  ORF Transcript_6685/g.19122 Transcript_6685/m.19122 type:complete len:339 (-) Transcript_6685:919-1935(-)
MLQVGHGGPDSEAWLLLHGWSSNLATYLPLLKALGDAGKNGPRTYYVPELRGHGRSSRFESYELEDYTLDAVNVAKSLGLERFTLVGHSLGAAVAQMVAGTIPERVTELILLDPCGTVFDHRPAVSAAEHLSRVANGNGTGFFPQQREFKTFEEARDSRLEQRFGSWMSMEGATLYTIRGLDGEPGAFELSTDPLVSGPTRHTTSALALQSFSRRTTCPTMVIFAVDGAIQRFMRGGDARNMPFLHPFSLLGTISMALFWIWASVTIGLCDLVGCGSIFPVTALAGMRQCCWSGAIIGHRLRSLPDLAWRQFAVGCHWIHVNRPRDVAGEINAWLSGK